MQINKKQKTPLVFQQSGNKKKKKKIVFHKLNIDQSQFLPRKLHTRTSSAVYEEKREILRFLNRRVKTIILYTRVYTRSRGPKVRGIVLRRGP